MPCAGCRFAAALHPRLGAASPGLARLPLEIADMVRPNPALWPCRTTKISNINVRTRGHCLIPNIQIGVRQDCFTRRLCVCAPPKLQPDGAFRRADTFLPRPGRCRHGRGARPGLGTATCLGPGRARRGWGRWRRRATRRRPRGCARGRNKLSDQPTLPNKLIGYLTFEAAAA